VRARPIPSTCWASRVLQGVTECQRDDPTASAAVQGQQMLAEITGCFTDGVEFADLKEARTLLDAR
jgi:hypothetical protein